MSQLYCGAAKRCITPPVELLPRLVGLKQHRFAGVLDDIHVRAAVFTAGEDSLLLLGFDMTTAPCSEEILNKLVEATGIPEDHIFFYSIHTHAVPFNALDMEERERQSADTLLASEAYTQYLYHEAVGAAAEALANRQPARMGWAFGESGVNVCRLQDYLYSDENGEPFTVCNLGADFSRPADHRLFTLRVESLAGEPILFMVNYPMHNVATIWNDLDGEGRMGVSGDIGGNVSRLLELRHPGSVALWQSGAAGDLKKAREIAAAMAGEWAMGDTGDPKADDQAILRCAMEAAREALRRNEGALRRLADALIQRETLTGEEIEGIVK